MIGMGGVGVVARGIVEAGRIGTLGGVRLAGVEVACGVVESVAFEDGAIRVGSVVVVAGGVVHLDMVVGRGSRRRRFLRNWMRCC